MLLWLDPGFAGNHSAVFTQQLQIGICPISGWAACDLKRSYSHADKVCKRPACHPEYQNPNDCNLHEAFQRCPCLPCGPAYLSNMPGPSSPKRQQGIWVLPQQCRAQEAVNRDTSLQSNLVLGRPGVQAAAVRAAATC